VRAAPPLVVAFDFASARAAVAVAEGDELRAALDEPRRPGDGPEPLVLVERALDDAKATVADVGGWIALAGPGSFTGVRIACATALGLAQATGRPAAGVDSLEALALSSPPGAGTVLAVVDALRGEWFVARFHRGPGLALDADGEERRVAAAGVELGGVDVVVGYGLEALSPFAREASAPPAWLEPANPVAAAARAASLGRWPWSHDLLVRPRYLRAPATTAPK
jgi:tRNA threonylcarbamoyladenosine biosynthesis protein TsaB